ncbi:hypothetical protein AB4212_47885, partial [Streptomyces sp. 2MCAF27]
LSHVALYDGRAQPSGAERDARPVRTVADHRLGLSPSRSLREALLGSDLVVLTSEAESVGYELLSCGAVLINATGGDVREELYESAGLLCVDDHRLLPLAPHRRAARLVTPPPSLAADEKLWHRPRYRDERVLVDLYGTGIFHLRFVIRLCREALVRGLGTRPVS